MSRHAIITASDARCGDFLVLHWLRSLRENVDLCDVDVVVLDFGLDSRQRSQLEGVIRIPARREGSVNYDRRRETARFLEHQSYDQVLAVDAGDLIFQRDIRSLFDAGVDGFRGVPERFPLPKLPFLRGAPAPVRRFVRRSLAGRHMVNGGFLLAPAAKFRELARRMEQLGTGLRHDQALVSGLLHELGLSNLEETYNYVPWTAREGFLIEAGHFFTRSGEKIAVVHNTGMWAPFRIVSDFGYGPEHNRRVRRHYLWAAAAYRRAASTPSTLLSPRATIGWRRPQG